MYVFNEIFNKVNNHNKDNFNLNIFFSHFSNKSLREAVTSQFNWKKRIKTKFFILKNFYFHKKIDNSTKEEIIEVFNRAQNKLFALYKFKNLFMYKFKKYKGEQLDLNFNELIENNKYNVVLIQNNNKNIFYIFDLIKIICNSLSFECNFFAEPKVIKNPWNNSSFSLSNLYNIYFFIKNSSIEMPILLLRFFQSSFCLRKFKDENQLIIKQYIINNYKNFETDKKINYITKMLTFYNNNIVIKNDTISIDPLFPKEKLLPIFEKYIKMFFLSKFSYESDIRIKNKGRLKKKLKEFKNNQPLFGRRIVSVNIRKLYCISELKYHYNHIFFTNCYIPPKELIFLNRKSYFIDYNPNVEYQYSIFPSLDPTNPIFKQKYNISNLSSFIKNVTFSESQKQIIRSEFKPIFDQIKNEPVECNEYPQPPLRIEIFLNLMNQLNDLSNHQTHLISDNESANDHNDDDTLVDQFEDPNINDENSDTESNSELDSDDNMDSDNDN
jgi:hypothetical protein